MYANPSTIPSVQVGAGFPLQSTSAIPQAPMQSNLAPVQTGSIMGVPPGTLVPVQVGNNIVQVPTQPVQTQTVHMSIQPQPQYQTISVPVTSTVEAPVDLPPNVVPAPQYGQATTPSLKTLPARIIKKELPPQYKQKMLPAKVVTQRLPPIGPPATPEPTPVQSAPVYEAPRQSIVVQQVPTQTLLVPVVQAPQYQTVSVPVSTIQTAPIAQPSVANYGTTSVLAQF